MMSAVICFQPSEGIRKRPDLKINASVTTNLLLCFLSYRQSSPDVFIPKHRSSDLEAISRVIQDAQHFIYISIIDYLPLLNVSAYRSAGEHPCRVLM